MNELQARHKYLAAVGNALIAGRQSHDRRRTEANRRDAFFRYIGLVHVQRVFYTEWMTHFSEAKLKALGMTSLAKRFSGLRAKQ